MVQMCCTFGTWWVLLASSQILCHCLTSDLLSVQIVALVPNTWSDHIARRGGLAIQVVKPTCLRRWESHPPRRKFVCKGTRGCATPTKDTWVLCRSWQAANSVSGEQSRDVRSKYLASCALSNKAEHAAFARGQIRLPTDRVLVCHTGVRHAGDSTCLTCLDNVSGLVVNDGYAEWRIRR